MPIDRLNIPKKPGIYTLVIFAERQVRTTIGKLGPQVFPSGLYTYTGSAIGRSMRLRARVRRHLASRKKQHWHIDYLLALKAVEIKAVVYAETSLKMECQVVNEIKQLIGIEILVRGFGASDCRYGCVTHLQYFQSLNFHNLLSKIIEVYEQVFSNTSPIERQRRKTESETNNIGWIVTKGC